MKAVIFFQSSQLKNCLDFRLLIIKKRAPNDLQTDKNVAFLCRSAFKNAPGKKNASAKRLWFDS